MRDDVRAALNDFARKKQEFWNNPVRDKCPVCLKDDNRIIHTRARDGYVACSDCMLAMPADGTTEYPCDKCGDTAFRDPAFRVDEYLCANCHREDGYIPTERSMISRVMTRQSPEHSQKRVRDVCTIDVGTEHGGEVKPRGRHGNVCARHWNPKKWMEGVQ